MILDNQLVLADINLVFIITINKNEINFAKKNLLNKKHPTQEKKI